MALSVSLEVARIACADSIDSFQRAAESFSEYELLGASRCHGWSRLDVVTHVLAGWQDMLGGMVSPVDDQPSVDAATYWSAFAAEYATNDRVTALMSQRRRTAAYARPASALGQLQDVAAAVRRGVISIPDRSCLWQGHVFGRAISSPSGPSRTSYTTSTCWPQSPRPRVPSRSPARQSRH